MEMDHEHYMEWVEDGMTRCTIEGCTYHFCAFKEKHEIVDGVVKEL